MILERYLEKLTENSKLKIYDKVKWHTDANISLKITLNFFHIIFNYLKNKKLLNKHGIEISKIENDTSIDSSMLTNNGIKIMDKCYDQWVKKISYKNADIKIFDKCPQKQ